MFETPEGASLFRDVILTGVDFDAAESRTTVERYSVINLPTVLVLDAAGVEIERVQGYDAKDDWLEQTRAALAATDPIPVLEERARSAPDDAGPQLELGWRLLVRGQIERGEAFLERAVLLDPRNEAGHASAALYVLGRFYQRVKLDFRTGRNLWRELATRFPRSEEALSALSWWAKAEAELGHVDLGAEILRRAASASDATPDHVLLWASYAAKRNVDRDAARTAAQAALGRATGETADELREVIAELGAQ